MKLHDFVRQQQVRMTTVWVDYNPYMEDSRGRYNWKCYLRTPKGRMQVYFTQGWPTEPEVDHVLDCLAMDVAGVENASFDEWCKDYGYSADSRRAERTYKVILRQRDALQRLFDSEAYETLLYHTERL